MKKLFSFYFAIIFCTNVFAYEKTKTEEIFTDIYNKNFWADSESVSGSGSNLLSTRIIRKELPILFKKFNITSLLDVPCGDFNWMKLVVKEINIQYMGIDIVKDLIKKNNDKFGSQNISFLNLDLISDNLPKADIILCRDCLLHFSYKDIILALKNFKKSGSKYILMTNFSLKKERDFVDIVTGNWRPINFNMPPFNFSAPIYVINEECPQAGFPDKCLALWDLNSLNL